MAFQPTSASQCCLCSEDIPHKVLMRSFLQRACIRLTQRQDLPACGYRSKHTCVYTPTHGHIDGLRAYVRYFGSGKSCSYFVRILFRYPLYKEYLGSLRTSFDIQDSRKGIKIINSLPKGRAAVVIMLILAVNLFGTHGFICESSYR